MHRISSPTSFQAKPIYKTSQKIAHKHVTRPKTQIPQKTNFSFWNLIDNLIPKVIASNKKTNYSEELLCHWTEKTLEKKGVNVRFKNDPKLAQYIQSSVDILEEKNIPLPKNILFMPSIMSKIGILGLTYMLQNKKESPIILPRNIAKQSTENIKKNNDGYFSTKSVLHIFLHEVGHWLHHQKGFSVDKNRKLWKNVDKELVKNDLSELALKCDDGSDFCAEIFVAQLLDEKIGPKLLNLAKKLNAPLLERDAL